MQNLKVEVKKDKSKRSFRSIFLVFTCALYSTDPCISQIEKILAKICPKVLDIYARIYGMFVCRVAKIGWNYIT